MLMLGNKYSEVVDNHS
jgi:hypothetical protein